MPLAIYRPQNEERGELPAIIIFPKRIEKPLPTIIFSIAPREKKRKKQHQARDRIDSEKFKINNIA
jgi:hypothetical protein